jgi:hypothetical protein
MSSTFLVALHSSACIYGLSTVESLKTAISIPVTVQRTTFCMIQSNKGRYKVDSQVKYMTRYSQVRSILLHSNAFYWANTANALYLANIRTPLIGPTQQTPFIGPIQQCCQHALLQALAGTAMTHERCAHGFG